MEGISDARKGEIDTSVQQKNGFTADIIHRARYSFQSISNEMDSSDNIENPTHSLDYFIEKLKGYFKLLLNQENNKSSNMETMPDEEIIEILGIEHSDLECLKKLIGHTEKFLNIIRNPDFISLLRSENKKEMR
jgi:hypothetical protein